VKIDLLTSGIWQTNTSILSNDGACVVVDPAYFPRELDAIVARVGELGPAEAVVFTHGHWDHVMGHSAFPDTPVSVSRDLEESVASGAQSAARYLDDAREFDSRWYVPRPAGHRWPQRLRGLGDNEIVELARIRMRALHLPGHSPDGLGLLLEEPGLLLVGDYLSPCEIPFVDDVDAYRATLIRLIALLDREVRDVIPGHGRRLTAADAAAIGRADLEYLERLAEARARNDAGAARGIALPRAGEVSGMRDHHRENCVAVGLSD
jgi:glyoxylase-like metal-dependent hydrolase (beta-lactamase superfamily II)